MSQTTYAPFVERMISKYEGGYGWNKKDPGGPTKYGITCYDLAEHMGQKMDSMERWAPIVRAMTLETADAIYKAKYASGVRYDDLPAGVDACMLDYGVNSGCSRAVLSARAIMKLPGRGTMDQPLLDAIKKVDPRIFIHAMCAERLHFMQAIRGGSAWAEFGGGWGRRVADLQAYCDHLVVGGAAPVAPELTHIIMPKALHVGGTAVAPTVGGVVGGAAATHVAGANWHIVAGVMVGVAVIGVMYEVWQSVKADRANEIVYLPPMLLPEHLEQLAQ
jgi:lysozyme family protein